MKLDSIKDFCNKCTGTLLSIAKAIVQSKWRARVPNFGDGGEIVILGNGPSLNETLAKSRDFLNKRKLLAVNFAANAPVFAELKPQFYVLADPHFFVATDQPNVARLWLAFSKVNWDMVLFIPHGRKLNADVNNILSENTHITIIRYNMTPIEGFDWFENFAFSAGLGMPRPRNVLIPSIMLAIGAEFKTIYVAGADHSWTKTISVDDDNNVVSIQPHFYKEDDREVKRVNTEYMRYPLHQIMYSFYVAFRSYFTIARYAQNRKISIFNITPNSFIDAFPRKKV